MALCVRLMLVGLVTKHQVQSMPFIIIIFVIVLCMIWYLYDTLCVSWKSSNKSLRSLILMALHLHSVTSESPL